MRVLFAVNSNGLGHATRSIPLIKAMIARGHEVSILSNNRALEFLKQNFESDIKHYITLADYSLPNKFFTKKHVSIRRFMINVPLYLKEIGEEHLRFMRIQKRYKFELIISDTRFGVYDSRVPSYLLDHHIKVGLSGFFKHIDIMSELALVAVKQKFDSLLIPDFERRSLGGDYTHHFKIMKDEYQYLGMLSMMKKQRVKSDIDYFFSISGPEPQRTIFEKKVLSSIKKLKGNIVVTLGKPEVKKVRKSGNATIYGCLNAKDQCHIMNRSKLIITRSGYSTVMDLAELGKRALLIPTKGQPEQEYLAQYHLKQGNFYTVSLDDFKVERDLCIAQRFPGFQTKRKTADTVKHFLKIVAPESI
jgi:uncharacterized protein (TIGR00661 family)